ncbi:MAG TPA: SPOR domain-containing protein [Terriglobia bacterium]|nr:SPOR domain-containing protein [Terriglobia bacterium]
MIEEQTTWKGHTFTLLVFTGIVVLCSIFFILGMLVGRQQGQKFASVAAAATKSEAKAAPKEDKPDFTFYDSVKKQDSAALQPPPAKAVPAPDPDPEPVSPPPAPVEKAPAPAPAASLNYQIAAVRKAADADKLLEQVKKKGFKGFILAPPEGDANPFFRVQVGPFSDQIEAQEAKKKLESAGYQPILKK